LASKLLNSVDRCVDEALEGIVSSSGCLSLLRGHRVVVRADLDALKGRVALLSGGGSGHEPAHAGYIGSGMLSAAVAGGVFASPPPASVLAAILCLRDAGVSGVLLIVKNYTGDRLNFGLAAEQARNRGVAVEMVVVADDCAFDRPSKAGRRGLCGTVFVHKLAGALAEEGCPLDEIVSKVTEAVKGIGTLGVSLSPCSVPGQLSLERILIYNDGQTRVALPCRCAVFHWGLKRCWFVVKTMVDHMTNPASQSHLSLKSGTRTTVTLFTFSVESLFLFFVAMVTEGRGVRVARVMSGSFMTSLEMAGVSLSMMRADQEILRLFDAKTTASAWPNLSTVCISGTSYILDPPAKDMQETSHTEGPLSDVMRKALEAVCSSLLQRQEELNSLDRASGDGDCGNTHAQAAKAIQEWLPGHIVPGCPGQLLSTLAGLVQERMGGSSGALYSLFLTAAAALLKDRSDPAAWANAMHAGTDAMRWCKAELGAESTRDLTARAGRASYIATVHVTLPDPGAVAIAAILRAVFEALGGQK
uniref:Triokinase/FMN cyclase n=1 Tax=Oncorhynchus mykiss TaxID=8022 RepID=A0A8K9XUU8_ONCMY